MVGVPGDPRTGSSKLVKMSLLPVAEMRTINDRPGGGVWDIQKTNPTSGFLDPDLPFN